MKDTKIRWAEHTWNPMTGCTVISPGCDHCYAKTIAEKFRGTAFPNGFAPTYKPHKLDEPAKWRTPSRVFVNSMSDLMHAEFTDEQRDTVFDRMTDIDRHDYLVLTKRPQILERYISSWLDRRNLDRVPHHIWVGVSIESDRYTFRADILRRIPADTRFLSCEPLLGPLPSLNLDGIHWVIVGGESGPGYRPMDHQWARDIRDACHAHPDRPAFYFKQSAAPRTETGIELDGELHENYPHPHPSIRHTPEGTRVSVRGAR